MIKPGRIVLSTKIGIKRFDSPEAHQADIPYSTTTDEDNLGVHILDLLERIKDEIRHTEHIDK